MIRDQMTTEQAETVPDGSIRSVDFVISPNDDGLTLEGYAAVFGSPTHISNRFEGDFTETIQRGAFANVIRANPKPVMQFDHGLDTAIGSTPNGAGRETFGCRCWVEHDLAGAEETEDEDE